MSILLHDLLHHLDSLLRPGDFRDYCPNGLQIEGRSRVARLVTGVTASQALLDAAVEAKADAVLVHHGYFWRGEDPVITGIRKQRIQTLLQHDISLIAYHLPLDAHPSLGNNAQLALKLGFEVEADMVPEDISKVGLQGRLLTPMDGDSLAFHIGQVLQRAPLHIPGRAQTINRIAWCTGGAQSYIEQAWRCGVDAYLTGEISEQTVHFARETGLHFFAAGHHATERFGAPAVGEYLANKLQIEHIFIDIDNPA
jgi:dinuclear metal center YbgI/SA1388 family protein